MTKRILGVEDQADNMQILRELLTSAGYEMIEAEDGWEGVRAATVHIEPEGHVRQEDWSG
jgi:CheY-like chemotaxis protein